MKSVGGLFRFAVLALLLVTLVGVGDVGPVRPAAAQAAVVPAPVDIPAGTVDLHDGQMVKFGSTYYLYGTMYDCGFTWQQTNTPWCGFGVSTAASMAGPWSAPVLLFSPTAADPYNAGKTYQDTCGATGRGCFSPRMIQRTGWGANDGVWILWFNAPRYEDLGAAHGYMTMGCNGPSGPCGASAGPPYGSTYRPVLHQCSGTDSDAGLTASVESNSIYLVCPIYNNSVSIEQVDKWGTNGTGTGATGVGGLSHVEAMGAYQDATSGTWVMTYSDPNCGYCAGDGTGYATAPDVLGPWTAPANVGVAAPAQGRRDLSSGSCGGQPDTVSIIDGQPWQKIDLWTGQYNEKSAGLHFEPLVYDPAVYGTGAAGDGGLWRAPFAPWTCE